MKHTLSLLLVALLLAPLWANRLQAAEEVTTDADSTATNEPQNLLKPTAMADSWQFELTDGGEGSMTVSDDAIVFDVTKTDGTNWHVQAYQTGLPLKDGQRYVLTFKAKSPAAFTPLLLGLINEDDWHEIGLHEEFWTGRDYRNYRYTFTAQNVVEDNNRIGFILGGDTGTLSVKDMKLVEQE